MNIYDAAWETLLADDGLLDVVNKLSVHDLRRLIQVIVSASVECCASVADGHKGRAAEQRCQKAKGRPSFRFADLLPEAQTEIIAEERGEDIASEMIGMALRKLCSNRDDAA